MDRVIGECQGCRDLPGCQLGLSEIEPQDGDVVARADVACPVSFEGGPGVAHGGWTAAMFDDFLGRLMMVRGILSVTAELTVRYLRPVPVGPPLVVEAKVLDHSDGRWWLAAALTLASTGALLAEGEGVWVERTEQHWSRHEAWLTQQAP